MKKSRSTILLSNLTGLITLGVLLLLNNLPVYSQEVSTRLPIPPLLEYQLSRDGTKVFELLADELKLRSSIKKPVLWWPHDHGESYLYTSVITVSDTAGRLVQKIDQKIGFRRVRRCWSSRPPPGSRGYEG